MNIYIVLPLVPIVFKNDLEENEGETMKQYNLISIMH